MTENSFYGWYDDASQPSDSPTFDPPHHAPCPFCGTSIHAEDVRTHSLMSVEGYAKRSYFYRTHRTCADADPTGLGMDDFIFDMIKRNGD
jgi:hypothetical protein